jgi:hypothetical protein
MATRRLTSADLTRSPSGNGHDPALTPRARPLPGLRGGPRRAAKEESPLDSQVKGRVRPGKQVNEQPTSWYQNTNVDQRRRGLGQDEDTLAAIKAVRDLDAQASHAVWNFLRLINPGHDLKAFTYGPDGSEVLEQGPAQRLLDDLATRVGADYGGGLDQIHNVLGLVLITTGAACLEVEFDQKLTEIIDWHPIDPPLMTFKRVQVEEGGAEKQQLGQVVTAQWEAVNQEQVFYQPLDPDINDPYGRPPMVAAVQNIIWLSQLLADVRAMAHQQGFPRLDVSVVWDAIQKAAPPQLRDDPGQFQTWATEQLNSIVTDYENLAVDDTFIHYDFVQVGTAGGGSGSFDFASLNTILQRRVTMSLKALPITLGINDSTSETHASIGWQIQVAGIVNFQKIVKRLIEKAANLSIKFMGIAAHAKLEYEEIRTIDRLYEVQADFFDRRNAQFDVQMGWASNDEASERIVGHAAVGEPQGMGPGAGAAGGGNGPMGGKDAPIDEATQMPEWWNKLFAPPEGEAGQGKQVEKTPADLPGYTADPQLAWKLLAAGPTSPQNERKVSVPAALPFVPPPIHSTTALSLLRQARQRSRSSSR